MNELITEVFVEQPLISPGSANQPTAQAAGADPS